MTAAPVLQPAMRFEWERVVRRCRIGKTLKLVAYTLAQYGDDDGTNIRPGILRLAAVCGEMGASTLRRYVDQLLALGLIERVANGGGRNRLAAVYRLTIPEDLLDRVELLDTDEVTPPSTVSAVRRGAARAEVGNSAHSNEPSKAVENRVDKESTAGNSAPVTERSTPVEKPRGPRNSAQFENELRSLPGVTPLTQGERPPKTNQTHQPSRSSRNATSPARPTPVDHPDIPRRQDPDAMEAERRRQLDALEAMAREVS
jgi:hypothetical protein